MRPSILRNFGLSLFLSLTTVNANSKSLKFPHEKLPPVKITKATCLDPEFVLLNEESFPNTQEDLGLFEDLEVTQISKTQFRATYYTRPEDIQTLLRNGSGHFISVRNLKVCAGPHTQKHQSGIIVLILERI